MAKGTVKRFRLNDDVDFEAERRAAKMRNREAVRSMRRNRQHERAELATSWSVDNG
jgi:hypothetical protein